MVRKMKETIETIAKWHRETFPDTTLDGQITKFNEEWDEYFWAKTREEKIKELADVFIVACGIARFDLQEGLYYIGDAWQLYADSPFGWDDLGPAIEAKMKRNRTRTWGKTAEGTYHHTNEE